MKPFNHRYKIDPKTGCWNWTDYVRASGYATFTIWFSEFHSKTYYAHIFSYNKYKGEVPKGKVLDHLCRNRRCINPEHLEPVTRKENNRRGLNMKYDISTRIKAQELYKTGNYTLKTLGKLLGISKSAIQVIIHENLT